MSQDFEVIKYKKDDVICRVEDQADDLYYILSGQLLICSRSGHMVTPIAYLGPQTFFGEMSFFDDLPRSADVVANEDTEMLRVPKSHLESQFPNWLHIIAKNMTYKIRVMDEVIKDRGYKRKNLESIQPLDIEEQRRLYQLLATS